MILFEWDEKKAEINRRKHGVSLEEATLVFEDPYAMAKQDRIERGERRWQTLGMVADMVVMLVAHTVRDEEQNEVIRIISARRATRKERRHYEQNRQENTL